MKNIKLIKILSITLAIILFTISPLGSYLQGENAKAYALTFAISDKLMKQTMIPLLISGGLVFSTQQSADKTYEKLDDYLKSLGPGYELGPNPNDPQGPNIKLGDVLFNMALGQVIYDAASGGYKKVIDVSNDFFSLIKSWVDDHYNVGNNIYKDYSIYSRVNFPSTDGWSYPISVPLGGKIAVFKNINDPYVVIKNTSGSDYFYVKELSPGLLMWGVKVGNQFVDFDTVSHMSSVMYSIFQGDSIPSNNIEIIGTSNVVDNPNYDWNNHYTNNKSVTLPIETDYKGNPEVDADGYHIPSVDSNYWVNKEPNDIIEQNPSGIPQIEIPEVPENDPDKNILIYLKNILMQLVGIRNDTATINENSNIIAENFGNGNGNDGTDIPTGFDWGDFKKFFDIIFIFIYFIVILILILVKFLNLVFLNLVAISSNSDLFNQYPTILLGVNYIKNLKVGGLSITVHQAFEYVFMIFFFIFIIKQIRKLYDSFVYEENHRSIVESGIKSNQLKSDSLSDIKHNSELYENIKFTDYTKGL